MIFSYGNNNNMKNTKTIKTILFASLIVAMILPFAGMELIQVSANESVNNVVIDKTLREQKIDELGQAIEDKQIEGRELAKLSKTVENDKLRNDNARELELLMEEIEIYSPITPTKFIPVELKAQMDDAQLRLMESDLPIYAIGITSETGKLNVKVYEDKATDGIEAVIQEFVGKDIPLEIEYGTNTFKLQASNCTSTHGPCNPITGGSFEEDETNGQAMYSIYCCS